MIIIEIDIYFKILIILTFQFMFKIYTEYHQKYRFGKFIK